jgi:hypothetical protein
LAAIDRLLETTLPLVSPEIAASAMQQDAVSAAVLQITLFNAEISQLVTDPHEYSMPIYNEAPFGLCETAD